MAGSSFAFFPTSWTLVSKWRDNLSLDQLTAVNWYILSVTGLLLLLVTSSALRKRYCLRCLGIFLGYLSTELGKTVSRELSAILTWAGH